MVTQDPLTAPGVGPERFRFALHVVLDHRVGGVEDRLGRSVVLVEDDRRDVVERLLELHDVPKVSPAKFVDAVVDDDAVRHVGVDRVDPEVVHRAVIRLERNVVHGADRPPVAAGDQDLHARSQVRDRHEVVHDAVVCQASTDVEAAGRRHSLRVIECHPVALVDGLVAQAPMLAGSQRVSGAA